MTATTALTAQNTQGVQDVHITPPSFVEKQIRAVMEDGFLEGEGGVVKIGTYTPSSTRTARSLCRAQGVLSSLLMLNRRHAGVHGHDINGGEGPWRI